jgi:oligoendopeptidase F
VRDPDFLLKWLLFEPNEDTLMIGRLILYCFVLPLLTLASAATPSAAGQEGKIPDRSQIDAEYTWDLAALYPSNEAWESELKSCEQDIAGLAKAKGTLTKSPQALLEFLQQYDELTVKAAKVGFFASLLRDQDTRQPVPQAMYDRARTLAVKLDEGVSWFPPELLSMPDGRVLGWCKGNPKLAVYRHRLQDLLRQKPHVLSAREEQLMAMTGKLAAAPRQAFAMLANADMKFPAIKDDKGNEVQLSEGRYSFFMQSADRSLRERAFKNTLQSYLAYKNTLAATLAGSVQGDIFTARARNYASALESALAPDNVPVAVYDNLIATIHQNLPKLHRYMELRRRKLGIDKVHLYDTFVPLIEGEPPRVAYDEAVATITKALAPLGPEYLKAMADAFNARWIDVYETQGKRSGAYSDSVYAAHPFILLNYNNTYDAMSKTAHEMGHAMHSWFTQHNQPAVYGDYPIFLAEVASTSNEIVLNDYLRKHAGSAKEELFLVNSALESIRGTVINQTMWAEFEKLIHQEAEQGRPLTYETMSKIYRDLVTSYFGPSFAYDDKVNGYWLRIPHFYTGFYVYKYATSYSASVALTKGILGGDANRLNSYVGFLKAGGSDYPIDILKRAGVDMSTPQPIQDTMDLFGELLGQLEKLLK